MFGNTKQDLDLADYFSVELSFTSACLKSADFSPIFLTKVSPLKRDL